MKKYIFIMLFFSISLFIIIAYSVKNSEISQQIKEYSNVQQISYELKILAKKRMEYIHGLARKINYDSIVRTEQQFQKQLEYYQGISKPIKDEKLHKILKALALNNKALLYLHEDIKTDYAVIRNSKIWLSERYTHYLLDMSNTKSDKEFLAYLFQVIKDDSMENELPNVTSNIFQSKLLRMHLKVIHKKQKSINDLNKELLEKDISVNIEKVILHTLKKLHKLEEERVIIIRILFFSTILLIFIASIVYVREVLVSIKAKKLKNELQQFVDALNESAIVSKADLEGNIIYANDKFCKISEYTRAELIGKSHNIVRHPDMDDKVFQELWDTIKKKRVFKASIMNRSKSGKAYYVDTSIMPILDVSGDIEEYLAVRYDVTELVKSRDMAVVAEKAKGEFLSNMSHELRTPLNAINGFSSILSRQIKDTKHLEYLQNIMDSSDSLIGLINDILDLSKLQSGKFSLDYQEFNLQEKTDLLLERLSPIALKEDVTIVKKYEGMEVYLTGDWQRISQIITNLLSNAVKFSTKGKSVEIAISYTDEILTIKVTDNGIGMSQKAQDKIFKPFIQADNSTTRKYGGTGLGLSIVSNLVEQMNATLALESKEGVGSSFEVKIPLKKAEVNGAIVEFHKGDEKVPLSGHILIAEDNKTNQMLVGILMEEFGLTYTMAKDGVEAVEMFPKEKFDLVLMDENMPNLNGCEAMKKIHEAHGKAVPIIALTANAMSGDRERFIELGMSDYVAKPIDDDELYSVMKSFLEK